MVCKWFCLLANVVGIYYFFGINGTPTIDFQFSLLAAISKRGSGTAPDDDDERVTFQSCTGTTS